MLWSYVRSGTQNIKKKDKNIWHNLKNLKENLNSHNCQSLISVSAFKQCWQFFSDLQKQYKIS